MRAACVIVRAVCCILVGVSLELRVAELEGVVARQVVLIEAQAARIVEQAARIRVACNNDDGAYPASIIAARNTRSYETSGPTITVGAGPSARSSTSMIVSSSVKGGLSPTTIQTGTPGRSRARHADRHTPITPPHQAHTQPRGITRHAA